MFLGRSAKKVTILAIKPKTGKSPAVSPIITSGTFRTTSTALETSMREKIEITIMMSFLCGWKTTEEKNICFRCKEQQQQWRRKNVERLVTSLYMTDIRVYILENFG